MNTIDLLHKAKASAKADNKLFARAINLLQSISAEIDGNKKVNKSTLTQINKLLDDNYAKALQQ